MTDKVASTESDFECVRRKLTQACEQLLSTEENLLFTDVNERSITHRLAVRLEQLFDKMDVDCEYNRDLLDVKRLPTRTETVRSNDTKAKTVYPDIIVHKRRSREHNLLVVEAKKNEGIGTTHPSDEAKLRAFTDCSGDFKYHFGAFVNFQIRQDPYSCEIRWYANGQFNNNVDTVPQGNS